MSAGTVVKKRGRPRKSDKTDLSASPQDGEAAVTTSKRSTATRSITTAKTSSKDTTLKKPTRRKKIAEIDGIEATDGQLAVDANAAVATKEMRSDAGKPPRESRILDEAKAFQKLKAAGASPTADSTGPLEDSTSPLSASHSLRPARNITVSESSPSSTELPSSSPAPKPISNNATQSSFLSGFLSDTPDTIPEAPESSKIVDRTAFKSQSLSIDDIVSGAGVSDLTTLTAAIQQKVNAKRERESAIPITAAKSFKSHSLNAFPDKAETQKVKAAPAQKYVNPETYALGSFQRFKASSQAATASSSSVSSGTKQSPQIPPASTFAQTQSKSAQQQKAGLQTSSSPTPLKPQQTQPSSSSSPPTPSTTYPTTRLPKPPTQPHPSTLPHSNAEPPHFRPKRPTEMTPTELLKNPEFKSLSRKWTALMVGIPVLVVTSWLLWDRMDREDKGVVLGDVVEEKRRRRGELPRRILDDGGLERGGR